MKLFSEAGPEGASGAAGSSLLSLVNHSRAAVLLLSLTGVSLPAVRSYGTEPSAPSGAVRVFHDADFKGLLQELHGRVKNSETFYDVLRSIDSVERTAFSDYLEGRISQDKPRSWKEHLEFQYNAKIYYDLSDLDRYRLLSGKVAGAITDFYLDSREWALKDKPFDELARSLTVLRDLSIVTPRYETRELCNESINKLLDSIDSESRGFFRARVKEHVTQMEKIAAKGNEEWLENFVTFAEFTEPSIKSAGRIEKEEGVYYFRQNKKVKWSIGITDPGGPGAASGDVPLVILRKAGSPGTVLTLFENEFISAVNDNSLRAMLSGVSKDIREQRHGPAADKLKAFDLPEKGLISHIRLFPATPNYVIDSALIPSQMYCSALKHRYGERVITPPVIFSDYPEYPLMDQIERDYKKGVRFFSIEPNQHGTSEGIHFLIPFGAADIMRIAAKYPDCSFMYGTIACHGGGLREPVLKAAKDKPEAASRVSVFLQTRPHMVNVVMPLQERHLEKTDEISVRHRGSAFMIYLIEALEDPEVRTFGEAVHRADLKALETSGFDAECVVKGQFHASAPVKNGERRPGAVS